VTAAILDQEGRLLLYAPNVHTGGGLVLLQALLEAWPQQCPLTAWLDERARAILPLPSAGAIEWVRPTFASRLRAEFSLRASATPRDRVLCFHGLPPLLPTEAQPVVFLQNRHYLAELSLTKFSWRTRLRLRAEQFISKQFRHRVAAYWVQTPSMARSLQRWFGPGNVEINVLPFAVPFEATDERGDKDYDFVYVADGEAHKNHRTLVAAWVRLKQRGLAPSLALTLSHRDGVLKDWVASEARAHGLNIDDLGVVPHAEVSKLYGRSHALIFPSLSESFGLPLIEAGNLGLPILAGELDFVRDVSQPSETFDPSSPVSIERAVLRFLGKPEAPPKIASAADFLNQVMKSPIPSSGESVVINSR
jgi:glycosyltransferase involved in cell wall biosynthesis